MQTSDAFASTTTLGAQLREYKQNFIQRVDPARVAVMETATAALRATGIEQQALNVGDLVPPLSMPDALGRTVDLRELWQQGPLVVVFYRGGWCPYCNLELRAWQNELDSLAQLGATLVAISPQTPDTSLSTVEKNELRFPVLSDSQLEAAKAFGVGFDMPAELVKLYSGIGHDLPVINGNGQWYLPIPATYVIGVDGRVLFAHLDADYRERAEPAVVMACLRQTAA